ncbi:MAG TPA: hypothetical protein VGR35_06725 [Tepidisphaeraceae bacterium]|nr:hypothetical protein [Tepidisphaeraceae bacterium]
MSYPPPDRVDHPEIQSPPTERLVPEDERRLPTAKKPVLVLSIVSAVLSIAAGFVCFQLENELLGLILAILGLVAGAVAWMMAYGDARTGSVTPAVATITAIIFCIIIGMDLADVEDATETPDTVIVPVPGTAGEMAIPEDPAAIIDPDMADDAPPTTQP